MANSRDLAKAVETANGFMGAALVCFENKSALFEAAAGKYSHAEEHLLTMFSDKEGGSFHWYKPRYNLWDNREVNGLYELYASLYLNMVDGYIDHLDEKIVGLAGIMDNPDLLKQWFTSHTEALAKDCYEKGYLLPDEYGMNNSVVAEQMVKNYVIEMCMAYFTMLHLDDHDGLCEQEVIADYDRIMKLLEGGKDNDD